MRSKAILAVALTAIAVSPEVDGRPARAEGPRSIWSGVYTEPQMRRGEQLYAARCSRCHGADLAGLPWEPLRQAMPEAARFARPDLDRTPELAGPTFYSNYDKLSLADLVHRIKVSMPKNKPGSLSWKDSADVMAYLLFYGGFPLGLAELSDNLENLRQIQILAHRQ